MPKKRGTPSKTKKTTKPSKSTGKKKDGELSLEELDHVSGGVGVDLSKAGIATGKSGVLGPYVPGTTGALAPYVPILSINKPVK